MQCVLPRLWKDVHQVFDDRVKRAGLTWKLHTGGISLNAKSTKSSQLGVADFSRRPLVVVYGVVVQVAATDNAQKSMDLIECGTARGRIVDGLRQCLDSDVDDHPESNVASA